MAHFGLEYKHMPLFAVLAKGKVPDDADYEVCLDKCIICVIVCYLFS